jgi:undecaprenyl-diphosphatase
MRRVWMLGAMAASAGLLAVVSRSVRRRETKRFDLRVLDVIGSRERDADRVSFFAEPSRVIAGALVLASLVPRLTPRQRLSLVAAPVLASALGEILKWTIPRERPAITRFEPHGGQSFPSTHTSSAIAFAFSCANVAWRCGGGAWCWVPAVVLGSAVGVERIRAGAHWPSDVAGGIALGTLAASTTHVLFDGS